MKQFQFLLQEGFLELLVSGWYMEIEVGVGQCLINFAGWLPARWLAAGWLPVGWLAACWLARCLPGSLAAC